MINALTQQSGHIRGVVLSLATTSIQVLDVAEKIQWDHAPTREFMGSAARVIASVRSDLSQQCSFKIIANAMNLHIVR